VEVHRHLHHRVPTHQAELGQRAHLPQLAPRRHQPLDAQLREVRPKGSEGRGEGGAGACDQGGQSAVWVALRAVDLEGSEVGEQRDRVGQLQAVAVCDREDGGCFVRVLARLLLLARCRDRAGRVCDGRLAHGEKGPAQTELCQPTRWCVVSVSACTCA